MENVLAIESELEFYIGRQGNPRLSEDSAPVLDGSIENFTFNITGDEGS